MPDSAPGGILEAFRARLAACRLAERRSGCDYLAPHAQVPFGPISRGEAVSLAVITVAMLLTRRDLAYTLLIAWGYVGVAAKLVQVHSVSLVALVLAAAVLVLAVLGLLRRGEGGPAVA